MANHPASSFTGHHLFSSVDQHATTTTFVTHLDKITALDQALAYKRQTYDLLQIQPGQRLLDVGCGAGDDVRAMAERVGAAGRVIGLTSLVNTIATNHPEQADQAAHWLAGIKQAGQEGAFIFMLLGITVVGTKA